MRVNERERKILFGLSGQRVGVGEWGRFGLNLSK